MHVSEARRILPRVASAVLVSAAVAVLSVPAARSAWSAPASRPAARTAPVDLYRGQQWTLDALHIARAWKYSRGNGVTVAVLDTGVDGHQPDLSGRVIDGPDFTGHARKPGNRYWGRHGTEMASLIAGHGHGAGGAAGVMGVAPDAKILSIRVTWELNDPIRADHSQVDHARDAVANGIRYAADHGAQVISMSLGGGNLFYNGNAAEEAAIKYAIGKGAVLIASAGNDGNGANRRNYPAAYPGVVAVGAVDREFKPARFTNRHTYISVAAPGVEIVSADATGHGYILGTGTSSSAAFVAGMSALVKARYPRLTPPEVKQSLEEGATHRPADGRSNETGTGVADAYGALRTAARINKAEHGGPAVNQSLRPAARPSSPPARSGPDLLLIAVLSGGGTLIVLSLILGWRQRRRRAPGGDDEKGFEQPPPLPVGARASSRTDDPSWDRRPGDGASPHRPSSAARSPWERRPPEATGGEAPPWEPGSADASPPMTPWDRRQLPSAPREAWDRPSAEAPSPEAHFPEPPFPEPRSAREPEFPSGEPERPAGHPRPYAGPSRDRPQEPPASVPFADDPRTGSRQPGSIWDRSLPEPADWDALDALQSGRAWNGSSSEAPPPGSGWKDPGGEPPDDRSPEDASRIASGWHDPQAEPPPSGTGARDVLGTTESWEDPQRRPGAHETLQPYDPPSRSHVEGNGTNGRRRSAPRDFRVAGGQEPDPLTDELDSSSDMGTPLADESWDSIRRGFDRLKDASNWESLAKGDFHDADDLPAQDAFDETASLPIIDPDEDQGGKN